ncbi:MAG: hypothetical protein ABWZ39_11840 [Pseudomonas caspiana]
MQRITRDATPYPPALLHALESKIELLHRYFPPSIASLYAIPRTGGEDTLQWWSELGGQPLQYRNLNITAQQALIARYTQRQQAIRLLVDELQSRGKSEHAQTLSTMIGPPDLDNLYSLNEEPVIIRWGLPLPAKSATPLPAAKKQSPLPITKSLSRNWWLRVPFWLLALPLVLLLLWLLWTWRGGLWHLIRPAQVSSYACEAGVTAPDFVVVLDTSGSMNLNINTSAEDEAWMNKMSSKLPDNNPRKARLLAEPTRLTVAKQAFGAMVDHLHPDIDTRLITFQGCERTVDHGVFAPNARQQLITGVNQLDADDGTPLTASLIQAASKVDGRFKDAVVVMFVDGEDGCDKNACEASARIANQQPRLRVNLVNISDSKLSNCIAENTGGRVYAARDAAEVQRMLRQAMEEVADTPACADAPATQ